MRLSLKESRMKFLEANKVDRESRAMGIAEGRRVAGNAPKAISPGG
jgi:hypothetical protein